MTSLSLALKNTMVTPASQAQTAILDYLVNLDFFSAEAMGREAGKKRKQSYWCDRSLTPFLQVAMLHADTKG